MGEVPSALAHISEATMNAVMSMVLACVAVVLLSTGQAHAGVTVIPEPSSFALIAAGAAAVAWAKFRRRG
jgi:hypothetical protein